LDIFWNPSKGDPWNILARQYVAALLNREALPCIPDANDLQEIDNLIASATALLESNCATIVKNSPTATQALALKDQLEEFNLIEQPEIFTENCSDEDETNDGPDTNEEVEGEDRRRRALSEINYRDHKGSPVTRALMADRHKRIDSACFAAQLMQDKVLPDDQAKLLLEDSDLLPGEPLLQCVGGFTETADYWINHINTEIYPHTQCAHDDVEILTTCSICGSTLLDIVLQDPTSDQHHNDSILHVAKGCI
jgi:hypothetical protein